MRTRRQTLTQISPSPILSIEYQLHLKRKADVLGDPHTSKSHSFFRSFHLVPKGQCSTCGVALLSPSSSSQRMYDAQSSGLGYRQSLGPRHFVCRTSRIGQRKAARGWRTDGLAEGREMARPVRVARLRRVEMGGMVGEGVSDL